MSMQFVYNDNGKRKSLKRKSRKSQKKRMNDGVKRSRSRSRRRSRSPSPKKRSPSPKKKRKALGNITNLPKNWKQLGGFEDGKRKRKRKSPLKLKNH